MAATKELFNAFKSVSTREWLEKINTDLKDKDVDSLKWLTHEGITVKPFYNHDDLSGRDFISPAGLRSSWHVIDRISVKDPVRANEDALNVLMHGAESIVFDLNGMRLGQDIENILTTGIQPAAAPVCFTNYSNIDKGIVKREGICYVDDRLMYQLRRQKYDNDRKKVNEVTFGHGWLENAGLLGGIGLQDFTVDVSSFKDAGADHAQELAYVIAIAREYFDLLETAGNGIERLKSIRVRMGIAGNFFFEISKLRALRKLWTVLCSYYGGQTIPVYLESTSSLINKSHIDIHTNMLRNTTECMAAVIGGADGISIRSHGLGVEQSNRTEGDRWAANISQLLKHESHFDKVADPAKGSYYVETLTDELADRAWEIFKDIGKDGGFIACWNSGKIEKDVEDSFTVMKNDIAQRRLTLIGVNDFPNLAGKASTTGPFYDHTENELRLPQVRLAAPFEKLRLRSSEWAAAGNAAPEICLFVTGKKGMSKARANYASNFLATAGLATIEIMGDDTGIVEKGNYGLVVLCSDNDSWEEWITKLHSRLNSKLQSNQKSLVWLAGDPSSLAENIRSLLDGAMYTGCNLIEKLESLQKKLMH